MSVRNLDALKALSSGSEIWFIADLESSRWSRKIDWYLNFQLAGAQIHRVPHVSRELNEIATRWDFDVPKVKVGEMAPLLIASSRLLPNSKTVVVPFASSTQAKVRSTIDTHAKVSAESVQKWIQQCISLWNQMKCPTVRVFLPDGSPDGIKTELIEKQWLAGRKESGFSFDTPIEIVQASTVSAHS